MMSTDNKVTVGPFTWVQRPPHSGGEEVWELEREKDAGLTHFIIKNYGGEPGPGFKGWKLVSGGPFDRAGAYATKEEAMNGVVPFLMEWYAREIIELMAKVEVRVAAIRRFEESLRHESPDVP